MERLELLSILISKKEQNMKSNITKLKGRGYIEDKDLELCQDRGKECLLALLNSEVATD